MPIVKHAFERKKGKHNNILVIIQVLVNKLDFFNLIIIASNIKEIYLIQSDFLSFGTKVLCLSVLC